MFVYKYVYAAMLKCGRKVDVTKDF